MCGHCDFGCCGGAHLVDIVVVDPTCRDSVELVARHDLVVATNHATRTKIVPFALETYDALPNRSDGFLVECAPLASKESARSCCACRTI